MTRLASLPIYDPPGLQAANDALWQALAMLLRRAGVVDVPAALTRGAPLAHGTIPPATLFSQTCGYPLRTLCEGQYQLLGIPHYSVPGCEGATHRAFIMVRADDPAGTLAELRGRDFAVNDHHSNTGMNLARYLVAPLAKAGRFFARVTETGSHAHSLARVQSRHAAAASIDCVTYAFLADHAPQTIRGLRKLCPTAPSPAIPFVTSSATSPRDTAALRAALLEIGRNPEFRAIREPLRLSGISPPGSEDYSILMAYEAEASRQDYPQLA